MIAIKLLEPAAWAYRHGLALLQYPALAAWGLVTSGDLPALRPVQLTMDPTDLLTLPALLVPWHLLAASRARDNLPRAATAAPCIVET